MTSQYRPLRALAALGLLLLTSPSCSDKDDTTNSETSSDSGAIGESCSPDSPCSSDGYCDYADDLCGTGEPTGRCVAIPKDGCSSGDPVNDCGCNGALEPDGCFLALNYTDISLLENCTDDLLRACGANYCTTFYPCVTSVPENGEPSKSCGPGFTTECDLDCDCLLMERPDCTECAVEDGRLLVTCPE